MRKLLSKTIFVLAALTVVFNFHPGKVQAAANKALKVSYSVKAEMFDTDEDTIWVDNHYEIGASVSRKVPLSKAKFSADLYVPKKALAKTGEGLDLYFGYELHSGSGKTLGTIFGKYTVRVIKTASGIETSLWRPDPNIDTDFVVTTSKKYVAVSAGTGNKKNYYRIQLKNIPAQSYYLTPENTQVYTGSKTKYKGSLSLAVTFSSAKKFSGAFYLDNFKVSAGSKNYLNAAFTKKPAGLFVHKANGKNLSARKYKIAAF